MGAVKRHRLLYFTSLQAIPRINQVGGRGESLSIVLKIDEFGIVVALLTADIDIFAYVNVQKFSLPIGMWRTLRIEYGPEFSENFLVI